MITKRQQVLAYIQDAVTDALTDISTNFRYGLTINEARRLVINEVLTEDNADLQHSIIQGLDKHIHNVMEKQKNI